MTFGIRNKDVAQLVRRCVLQGAVLLDRPGGSLEIRGPRGRYYLHRTPTHAPRMRENARHNLGRGLPASAPARRWPRRCGCAHVRG
jgi:hypothetical protein